MGVVCPELLDLEALAGPTLVRKSFYLNFISVTVRVTMHVPGQV